MSNRTLRILIYGLSGFLILFIGTGIYQRHFSLKVQTYAEIQYFLYDVSNQCIADYYADDLSTEGIILSLSPIIEDCKATHISKTIVKIYDTDGQQQTAVKAYQLHSLMIKLNANGCFMEKVVVRRLDNDKVIQDITDDLRELPSNDIIETSSDLSV